MAVKLFLIAAAATLRLVSDTLSTSIPSTAANHTIKFTTVGEIPASGKIVITPEAGDFNIPAGLDFTDLDLLINDVQKPLAASAGSGSGSNIGSTILSGLTGEIAFTLNDADGISAGDLIEIRIGTNATFGTTGDWQITNPPVVGSYKITIATKTSSGTVIDQQDAMVAIVESVAVSAQKEAPAPVPVPAPTPTPSPGPSGGGGPIAIPELPVMYTGLTGTVTVLPSLGALAVHQNPDGSSLLLGVPRDFWLRPVTFFINVISPKTLTAFPPPRGLSFLENHVYSVLATDSEGDNLQVFFKPLAMKVRYTPFQAKLISPASMKIYLAVSGSNAWQAVPGSKVELGSNEVVAPVSRLGLFAVLGSSTQLTVPSAVDFSLDGRVDLVDFSVLLFNWGRPVNNLATDINKDGLVDLVDFSIFLFWWTG